MDTPKDVTHNQPLIDPMVYEDEVKIPGGYKEFTMKGYSMFPYLQPSDTLLWRETEKVSPGDILVMKTLFKDQTIVHRCLDPKTTKGDREKWSDQRIHSHIKILGKVDYRVLGAHEDGTQILAPVGKNWLVKRLQALLCKLNSFRFGILHKLSPVILGMINKFQRRVENLKRFRSNY